MIQKLHILLAFVMLAIVPQIGNAQAPNLGTTTKFVLFSSNGAVSNTGITHLTGKVGTNNGSSTGFGNVNGGMHDGDTTSAQAATDLLIAYNQLNAAVPAFFPAPLLGNGQVLVAGTYAVAGAATLSNDLTFDAQNNPNAVFIIQIAGPLSTNANAKVKLMNGAQACNVYWKVEGLVNMAAGTFMRGTVIANNAGINMNSLDTLEGRAMSTAGAVTVNGVLAYTPIGCGSPVLNGPTAPTLGEAGCYGIFSADGPIENAGISNILGDVGANVGLTIGFDPLTVTGNIHPIPDGSTALAAADLLLAYTYVNTLSADIELLYPAQFGGNLVLTPHTYVLNGATTLTDSLFLDAQGSANAVFIIKIYGALETTSYARVVLINGTQAKNVYWMVNGAVELADYTTFNGSIISQGAISLFTGTTINGRALTGVGALATNAIQGAADIPTNCQTIVGGPLSVQDGQALEAATLYPNPFQGQLNIRLSETAAAASATLLLYNSMGALVRSNTLTEANTQLNVSQLPAGIYIYRLSQHGKLLQSGRLISK